MDHVIVNQYITWDQLLQFAILLTTIVGVAYTIFRDKK